jgi:predicted DsbA family dithiol-disulfide isomerase
MISPIMVTFTYYLDVVSSWCYYVEPVWRNLQGHYEGRVTFCWEVALIPEAGLPGSREEEEWYYRRSGLITRQAQMLNAGWWEPGIKEYVAPNAVAVAARKLGLAGDAVRLALTEAAILRGQKVGRIEEAVAVAAAVSGLDTARLSEIASSSDVEAELRASTAAFYRMGVSQRPTFHLESEIGDVAILSGLVHEAPLRATLDAMLTDVAAYRSWSAHFGPSWNNRIKI